MIFFTKHANEKFGVLKRHKFLISKDRIINTIFRPDSVDLSRLPLFIAQSKIDKQHVLRVVYKRVNGDIKIITFYPGRAKQYI